MLQPKLILVTGGCGYIGSHTVVELCMNGYDVVVVDNFCNSEVSVISNIELLSEKKIHVIKGDVLDRNFLVEVFSQFEFDAVMHFAGLKSVQESESDPLKYYLNNVAGSLVLLSEMERAKVQKLIFSSSATVYGDPGVVRYSENTPLNPINVYGKTKLAVEKILQELHVNDSSWSIGVLRYFNPVGAHISGKIGENPSGTPNNLMPFIAQVAKGIQSELSVYGGDYATEDGTAKRDYIHVQDLAVGHLKMLKHLERGGQYSALNLGTGRSYSVLEMLASFENVSGLKIPYKIVERRQGDLPEYYADPTLAKELLDWMPERNLDDMCKDLWRWEQFNSKGFV